MATLASDAMLKVWDAETGRLLATLAPLPAEGEGPSAEWLAHTPEGYYHGSPGASRFIRWQVEGELHGSEAYAGRFHRPERVARNLTGGAE